MSESVELLKPYPNLELLWASSREVFNVFQADSIGCDIITAGNDIIKKLDGVGKDLISMLGDIKYPTLLSFKGKTIHKYLDTFQKYAKNKSFAFQTSIITRDDELAKKIEPGVPSPTRRIEVMRALGEMGYWTVLRMRPFIIGITDHSLDQLLDDTLQAGIKAISTEFFALDSRINNKLHKTYKYIGSLIGVKDLPNFFSKLSPHERGGYMRLNRLVKEPYMKKTYNNALESRQPATQAASQRKRYIFFWLLTELH